MRDVSTCPNRLLRLALLWLPTFALTCCTQREIPSQPPLEPEEQWTRSLQSLQTPEGGRAADERSDTYDRLIRERQERLELPLVASFNAAVSNSKSFAEEVGRIAVQLGLHGPLQSRSYTADEIRKIMPRTSWGAVR